MGVSEFDHRRVLHYWDSFSALEKRAVIAMMTEVIKNHTYMTCKDKVKEAVQGLEGIGLEMHDNVYVRFKIGFVMNDLLAVVGAMRRRKAFWKGKGFMEKELTTEQWYSEMMRKLRKRPGFWWEYFKIWASEAWLAWKWRNKTIYEIIAETHPDLLHTAYWDEHPEDWNDGCFCSECRSYMANE